MVRVVERLQGGVDPNRLLLPVDRADVGHRHVAGVPVDAAYQPVEQPGALLAVAVVAQVAAGTAAADDQSFGDQLQGLAAHGVEADVEHPAQALARRTSAHSQLEHVVEAAADVAGRGR